MRHSHIMAGIAGLILGGFAVWESWGYPIGSLTRMGPGYFPYLLGFVLCALSLAVLVFEGRAAAGYDIPRAAWRGLIWVSLAVSAFALLVDRAGLVPAILAAVVLSAQADDDLSFRETVVLGLTTAAVCTGIFIYLLGMPLDAVKV